MIAAFRDPAARRGFLLAALPGSILAIAVIVLFATGVL